MQLLVVDWDGNPYVNKETMSYALKKQSYFIFKYYLAQLELLGKELSMSTRLVAVTEELNELANQSGDTQAHRQDEPYRRALIGVYRRLMASMSRLSYQTTSELNSVVRLGEGEPYRHANEFINDLLRVKKCLKLLRGKRLEAAGIS